MHAYKILTHDLRPPIQGGAPIITGPLPVTLPTVEVDTSSRECGAGYNACRELHTALRIAGLWPDGRPSRAFVVETDGEVVERRDKVRAASWTLTHELSEDEIRDGVRALSEPFGDVADAMIDQQMAWRYALSRPRHDPSAVERGLREALRARGLDWTLRRYDAARAAWDAWDARAARDARDAWDAWAARAAWDAWAARDAWDAWAARDALTAYYARSRRWAPGDPSALMTGLREAYEDGLGVALPVAPGVLGWAMDG